jgi:hypothetical protein
MKILFLRGWTSKPGTVKPLYLARHGHVVINPKLPDEDFEEAVRIAQTEFDKHQPQVVGESRGGTVAMNMKSGEAKLVLLGPGWKRWGTVETVKPGTVILHSRLDDRVPFADSEELVRNSALPASALIEVGNDLWLNAWKKYGTARTVKPNTVVLHSRADDVVPFADSEELVRSSGLPASSLVEVGSDHRLADPEPLAAMVRACGAL